jgi:hypothetical protein
MSLNHLSMADPSRGALRRRLAAACVTSYAYLLIIRILLRGHEEFRHPICSGRASRVIESTVMLVTAR